MIKLDSVFQNQEPRQEFQFMGSKPFLEDENYIV